MTYCINHCPQCREEKQSYSITDSIGIHLVYSCDDCYQTTMTDLKRRYRPEIFQGDYTKLAEDHGERIEPLE